MQSCGGPGGSNSQCIGKEDIPQYKVLFKIRNLADTIYSCFQKEVVKAQPQRVRLHSLQEEGIVLNVDGTMVAVWETQVELVLEEFLGIQRVLGFPGLLALLVNLITYMLNC